MDQVKSTKYTQTERVIIFAEVYRLHLING